MKIVITTQISENYGSHDWDGKGACPQYWKHKGGNVYVVSNLSVEQVLKIKDQGIPTLVSLIEQRNESFKEYILDWSILDNDAKVCAEWDSPFELSYEQGRWVARRTTENGEYGYMRREVASKTEQYDMLIQGDRENHKVVYTMRNGDVVDSKDVSVYLNKAA
jgi:hypothetical protein